MTHIFVVNPYAGKRNFAENLRWRLSQIPNFKYFIFNTCYAGHEADIVKTVKKIFDSEKLRFYCCGGEGTLRNMLNGFDDLSQEEIAFFPCGDSDNFLRRFGNDSALFHDIKKIIYGHTICVDYLKSNHGVMLDSFSVGLDVSVIRKIKENIVFQELDRVGLEFLRLFYSMSVNTRREYIIQCGEWDIEKNISEVCYVNSDGVLRVLPDGGFFSRIKVAYNIFSHKYDCFDKKADIFKCQKFKIRSKDGENFDVSQDGEIVSGYNDWEVEVVKKGLHLVVPEGVKIG